MRELPPLIDATKGKWLPASVTPDEHGEPVFRISSTETTTQDRELLDHTPQVLGIHPIDPVALERQLQALAVPDKGNYRVFLRKQQDGTWRLSAPLPQLLWPIVATQLGYESFVDPQLLKEGAPSASIILRRELPDVVGPRVHVDSHKRHSLYLWSWGASTVLLPVKSDNKTHLEALRNNAVIPDDGIAERIRRALHAARVGISAKLYERALDKTAGLVSRLKDPKVHDHFHAFSAAPGAIVRATEMVPHSSPLRKTPASDAHHRYFLGTIFYK